MSLESIIESFMSFDKNFINLLNASISSCWLVGAVLLFRLIFRKAPKWLTVALWAIVAVRLVCPVPIESSLSLVPTADPIPTEILNIDPHKGVESTTVEVITNPIYSDYVDSDISVRVESVQWDAVLGALVWFYGMGAMVLYAIFSYLRIYLKVRHSMNMKENIYLCDRINTPFIFGIVRPKIYLPSYMSEEDMTYVLAHEKAHLKRRDHLWKPVGFAILAVYWFNPVIWLSYILLCRDIELACDEKVIKELGAERKKPYSMALINCSVPKRMITACPVAFGETGVKQRIKAVLNYKKPALWLIIVAFVTSIIVVVCFMTSPKREGGTIPERNYLIQTDNGEEMFRFDEAIEYSEYFTVHKGEKSYFKATPGSGRSTVLNFLSSLSLERLPEMSAEGLNHSGKIEVINSDGNIEVIFCDGFSKVFMRNTGGGVESSLYAVDTETVKKFFEEEKYIKQGNIWECDFTSSAMGHGSINFYVDELCKLTEEPTAEGGRLSPYTSDEHGDGYTWTPEITDNGVGNEATVTFKGIMYGKEVTFPVKITKVGQNDNFATYYLISAEDTVVSSWGNNYEYHLSKPTSMGEDNEWYYNPNLSSKGYGSLSFSLPIEYKLTSVEAPKGRAEIDNKYSLEPEGEKLVYWAPEFDTYLTDESYEFTINALKKGEEVSFTVKVIGTEKSDEIRGRIFSIEPVDCIAVNKGWANYELREAEKTESTDLDKAVSKAILENNSQYRWLGECPAEGHVIFGTKEKGGIVTVYMIERYSNYGFEDGWFIDKSGHSVPAVMRFEKKDGQYTFLDVEYAEDGNRYTSSIKRLFPKIYESRAIHPTEKDNEQMTAQLHAYAKAHLDSIGRTEPIGTYSDLNTVLLTDVGVSVEVSNKLLGLKVNYDTGKIGYFEQIENDVRYIYRTSYFPEKNLIVYTKEVYGTGEIKEKIEVDSLTGNVLAMQNSPQQNATFDAAILDMGKNGDWILVEPLEGTAERRSSDKIHVSTIGTDLEGRTDIKKDTKVRIMYDGVIMETYPAQLNDVFAIYLHSELPDNTNKVPTTRAYYITGETEAIPTDFDIKFSFGGDNLGNFYDTYKDVIGEEADVYKTEEKPFTPSAEELQKIYDKAKELDIFSISGRMTASAINSANTKHIEPDVKYGIKITCEGKEYHINGDVTASFCRETSEEAARFCDFVSFMLLVYNRHI